MKHSSILKLFTLPLTFLLIFTLFYPLMLPSSYTPSNKANFATGLFEQLVGDPVVPQPPYPEYLIITPNSSWVESFALWKTLKGTPTYVANISWIQTNYPLNPTTRRDNAERIWDFINDVYTSTSGTLKWVLLIGDNSTIPSRYVYLPDTTEWTGLDPTLKPTDFYYSVMGDSNWDDDNDGRWGECNTFNVGGPTADEIGDWQPDIYVGRIPFSDQTNITSILTKTIAYARNPTTFSATGWDTFLLAGGISNYDEEIWAWHDGDYTDEAELSDYINDNLIPVYYRNYRFYENRVYFWNYSTTNTFQELNNTAVFQGLNTFSPALVNLAAHGSPIDVQRKYDYGRPYGEFFSQLSPVWNTNVTGVAIGDPDNDGTNEFVVTQGIPGSDPPPHNGTVWFHNDPSFGQNPIDTQLIWDLWRNPINGPTWATCVDIGDVWNNGTIAVVVGTALGEVIIFTYWNNIKWTAFTAAIEYGDPVLCIEVGNADNVDDPFPFAGSGLLNMSQTDIAWGHRSGVVMIATVKGFRIPPSFWASIVNIGQAVYSIDVGDPNDDGWNEVTFGTGYAGPTGDCYMYQYLPGAPGWQQYVIDINVGGIIYGLDTGNAGNDGQNKIAIGCSHGAIFMYEANFFLPGFPPVEAGSKRTIVAPGGSAGGVRCLRVGHVDDNDILGTTPVEQYSIIAGNMMGGIRKYHADNTTGLVDWTHIVREPLFAASIWTALDVGELTPGESPDNDEVVAGTTPWIGFSTIAWFEWPHANWDNLLHVGQAGNTTASIPHLVYADSCLTSAYDYKTDCLAERFLYNMAIGYVGSMRICWYYRGPMANSFAWGLGRWMSQNYWDIFFSGTSDYRPGSTLYDSKSSYVSTFGGTHTQVTWETYHRKNLLSYALFGDPEVDVFTRNPGTLTVNYPTNALYRGSTAIQVLDGSTPVIGATVCLWDQDGLYYEVQTTNTTGHAIFKVSASVPNSLNVTVTAHNYSPYESTIGVTHWISITAPTVVFNAPTLGLDITGVIANCSNPAHSYLDSTEATTYTYTIYNDDNDLATSLTGDLTWTGTEWEITDLDVSGLALGSYYARCTFADSDVSSTNSPRSQVFTLTLLPFDFFRWLLENLVLVIAVVVIVLVLLVICVLLRRRKSKES
ncbi:MAG: C25 family cysteine peptidase [Candidatus Hodarchaeota archaeon]